MLTQAKYNKDIALRSLLVFLLEYLSKGDFGETGNRTSSSASIAEWEEQLVKLESMAGKPASVSGVYSFSGHSLPNFGNGYRYGLLVLLLHFMTSVSPEERKGQYTCIDGIICPEKQSDKWLRGPFAPAGFWVRME